MKYVLDSHALMVFLEKEAGYQTMEELFVQAVENNEALLMTSVNYGEICYIVLRECGQNKLVEIEKAIRNLPIEICSVDLSLACEAAKCKAAHKISYADCFAAALAKMKKSVLVTGDPEFKQLAKEIKILWL